MNAPSSRLFRPLVAVFSIGLIALFVFACQSLHGQTASTLDPKDRPPLVPWPTDVTNNSGTLTLDNSSRIVVASDTLMPLAKIFAQEITLATGHTLAVASGAPKPGDINLAIDPRLQNEAYDLWVTETADVHGANYNAVAMGTVTLLQSMSNEDGKLTLPHLKIHDQSQFAYTGTMLDIARKPYSIATLKACAETARFYKIRYIQLHMSDENAWTFPSTAYPKAGSTNFAWAGGEAPPVYKLQELKDLVAYADARGVTFVPEFETPGHSGALRGSLPDIFGYKDAHGKPLNASVINGATEKAYQAIDTIVGEMSDVFKSSPYIHMGCDESGFGGTEKFPEVLDLVKREHLPNSEAIFSYFVTRVDGIVKKHGKQMIVWQGAATDPIVPPKDIIFMPWVGDNGYAADCLRLGYRIINPPWGVKQPYFDVYDVNGFEVPKNNPLLIGATSILWQASEDVALPYLRYTGALRNEPTRTPDSGRDLEDFLKRQAVTDVLLDHLVHGYTFQATGVLDPLIFNNLDPMFAKSATLTLQNNLKSGSVHYTLDGSEPTLQSPAYTRPIVLNASATLNAKCFGNNDGVFLYPYSRQFRKVTQVDNDALGAKVTYTPEPGYHGPGPKGLVDGILAPADNYLDPGLIGWHGSPVITLDLGKPKLIKTISPRTVKSDGGLDLPAKIEYQLSNDGTTFHTVASVSKAEGIKNRGWYVATLESPESAQYIRLNVTSGGEWAFMDEILVNGKLPGPNFISESMGKKITTSTPPNPDYGAAGIQTLTDGYTTPTASFAQLQWLGWQGHNIEAVIDMDKPTALHVVGGHFLQHVWSGIAAPDLVTILISNDGTSFKEVAKVRTQADKSAAKMYTISADLKGITARYVKFIANTNGQWLFTDELFVNPQPQQ